MFRDLANVIQTQKRLASQLTVGQVVSDFLINDNGFYSGLVIINQETEAVSAAQSLEPKKGNLVLVFANDEEMYVISILR